ncbi:putative DNA repair protein RecN [Photobacterium sp. SKA34]|nr:putative DNA repair protein RecN [Photobacterium sp. SKA34]
MKRLTQSREENEAQKQLLQYQVKELDELALGEEEFNEIEEEHKRLSNSGELAVASQTALSMLYDNDDGNALQLLQMASQQVCNLGEYDNSLNVIPQMLEEAIIQVQEASQELRSYLDNLDMDPHRLIYLEERLAKIMSMARKHYVMPNELYQKHQDLLKELDNLDCSDERLEEMAENVEALRQKCLLAAEKLSKSRQRYAKELDQKISESMHTLSMEHGEFSINIASDPERMLSPIGYDSISFLVSTNPGQPLQPLGKVASGGELSRISLAIQVITAQKIETPSLIFDEVDVGISGPTAAIVGKMLRTLGESTQVMCVTHLPQVAGCGHQQMFVAKKTSEGQTETNMRSLTEDDRIAELARLLGGSEITERTLANAKELLIAA